MKMGPTFLSELVAAGVSLDGLSWSPDEGTFINTTSPEQLAAAEAVLAAHDPTKTLPLVLGGNDVIDALSPAQVALCDIRDIIRLKDVPDVAMLKSKIARIAKANGMTSSALLATVTPSE